MCHSVQCGQGLAHVIHTEHISVNSRKLLMRERLYGVSDRESGKSRACFETVARRRRAPCARLETSNAKRKGRSQLQLVFWRVKRGISRDSVVCIPSAEQLCIVARDVTPGN